MGDPPRDHTFAIPLCPSFTSSISSMNSSLPNPKESGGSIGPVPRFSPDNIDVLNIHRAIPDPYFCPSGRTSPPLDMSYHWRQRSRPVSASTRDHVASPPQSKPRFHPYTPSMKATPLELRLVSRSLGLSSLSVRTLEDTQRVCIVLQCWVF